MLSRVATYFGEWRSMLREPSRESQLCRVWNISDVHQLRSRIAVEVSRLERELPVVEIHPSNVAGLGLFVRSNVASGKGLAFYLGECFHDAAGWESSGRSDDSYLLSLNTHPDAPRGCIDALNQPRSNAKYAAHLINHPPINAKASVVPASFRWGDVARELSGVGVLMVSLVQLQPGEELFLDYRLRHQATLLDAAYDRSAWHDRFPSWYAPVKNY